MPRRRVVAKREILPDPKYHNQTVAKFINHVMVSGKKSVAERIVYGALLRIEERDKADPVEVFEKALEAVAPFVEVKSPARGRRDLSGACRSPPLPPAGAGHALACGLCPLPGGENHGAQARRRTDGRGGRPRYGSQAAGRHAPHGGSESGVRALPLLNLQFNP